MAHRVSHLVRDVAGVVLGIAAVGIASWIFVGYGFALAIVLSASVMAAATVPFLAIYYEERDLPRDGRPRRF